MRLARSCAQRLDHAPSGSVDNHTAADTMFMCCSMVCFQIHKRAYVEYAPLGVLGVIAPWNYPFHNMYNHILSGIFTGNACITKVRVVQIKGGYEGKSGGR